MQRIRHVCEILNIFVLLDKFSCLILNKNLLLLSFLSRFFHLVAFIWEFEQYICSLDFCTFNLRRPPWFVCLLSIFASLKYGTPGDRTKLALNLHSWKTIYFKMIALFLSSLWCTTFIFLSLRCNISSGSEKIIRFLLFEFVLRVFLAKDVGIRIDDILLKRKFFNLLLLRLRRLRNPYTGEN